VEKKVRVALVYVGEIYVFKCDFLKAWLVLFILQSTSNY